MRRVAALPVLLLLLTAFAVPASCNSFDELKEVVKEALERLKEFEESIKEKSNSTSEIVSRVIRKGYDFYATSSTTNRVGNLNRNFYDRFVTIMLMRFKIPDEDLQEIKEKVFDKLKDEAEQGEWIVHKMLYNPLDDPEATKYVCVFGYVNDKNNFDLLTLEVKARFEVAKNLLIIQNKKTGKLSVETEEVETERLPDGADLNNGDVQLLLNFFEAIALRSLANKL